MICNDGKIRALSNFIIKKMVLKKMSITNVTDGSYKDEITDYKGYTLVDFWAPWCGPCRQLAPTLEEVAKEMSDEIKITKMDIDENPETPTSLGVRGIPALFLFHDGKQIASKAGSMPKSALMEWIRSEIGE